MKPANHARSFTIRLLILFCVLLAVSLTGCHSRHKNSQPTIEFTKIPPAAQGGRERTDTISGKVTGAFTGQKIVVFAKSGPWWVQPWPDQAVLPIQPDGTWTTSTHLGFQYAALLVDPSYRPPSTMDLDPTTTASVFAVNIVKGVGAPQIAPTVPLHFSGYDWQVRTIAADIGGVNNLFDPDNAWTDSSGALHLRMKKNKDGRWSCAHLTLARSLGYGTYVFVVRDTAHLEPAAVLSLTTFDDWGAVEHYREMDIELGKWGDAANKKNAQFAVQPFYVPGNVAPFEAPAGTLTHSLHWESGKATMRTVRGSGIRSGAPLVSEHVFTTGVPTPGQEKVLLMFYVVASDRSPMEHENEVVIEKFEYLP
ncbi:MAG TPA: hypothetical protein VGD60_06760 [Candidatus Acidoferrales bacterium]